MSDDFHCPACGEEKPPNAKSCAHCGASEKDGWASDVEYGAVGLPDDDFDYEAFVKDEFGGKAKPSGIPIFWWVTAIIVAIAFGLIAFGIM